MNETRLWGHENFEVCVRRWDGSYVVGYFSSYGDFVEQSCDVDLPERFVPLVPQTEVNSCSIVDEILGRREGEGSHAAARRVVDELAEEKATNERPAIDLIAASVATPPLPAVDAEDPTQWEFAASLVEASELPGSWSVDQLRWQAEGLRKEQSERAKRYNAYTAAALAVLTWVDSTPGAALSGCTPSMLSQIAVDAVFDITPKERNPQ